MPKTSLKINQFSSGLNTEVNERDLSIDSATVSTGFQGFTEGELGTLGGSYVSGHSLVADTGSNASSNAIDGLTGALMHKEPNEIDYGFPKGIATGCDGYGLFFMSHDKTLQYTPVNAENNILFFSANGIIYAYDSSSVDYDQGASDLIVTPTGFSNTTTITVAASSNRFWTGEDKYGSWKAGQYVVFQNMGASTKLMDELDYTQSTYYNTFKLASVLKGAVVLAGTLYAEPTTSAGAINTGAMLFRRVKVALWTGNTGHKTFYYNADGALRVCDRGLTTAPIWYGYINRTRYTGLGGSAQTINRWHSTAAYPAAPTAVTSDVTNAAAAGLVYTTSEPTAKHSVHVRMNFQNDTPYHTGATGWDDLTGPSAWKVGVSFVYDDNQESEITEASSGLSVATATYVGKWMSLYCTHWDGSGIPLALESMSVAPDIAFQASQTHTGWTSTTMVTGSGTSLQVKISTNASGAPEVTAMQNGTGYREGDLFSLIDPGSTTNIAVWQISSVDRWNERITGYRVYLREDSSSEFAKDFYYMGEFNLKDGGKKPFDSEYTAWTAATAYELEAKTAFYKSPSRAASYTALNGRKYNESGAAKFKTSVIANRRCYIGNIKHVPRGATSEQTFEDRMLKSVVNNFDIFPPNNYVDVAVNDGDKITHLAEYSNKILQFKSRKLYIINVAGDSEFLESTHDFMGVEESYQVVRHPKGVAWTNQNGVYNYDGSTPKRINFTIDSDYQESYTRGSSIGYDAGSGTLVISSDVRANDSVNYIYNFKTESWAKSIDMMKKWGGTSFAGNTVQTNFVNDQTGTLMYMQENSSSETHFRKWSSDSLKEVRPGDGNEWASPDIDFGAPGQKKNIYKVRITYKAGGSGCSAGATPKYSINGLSDKLSFVFSNAGTWINLSGTGAELPIQIGDGGAGQGKWNSLDLFPAKAEASDAGYLESEALVDINSFKIILEHNNSYIGNGLVINDITIFYRMKGER